jgi:hypothetical protein
MGWRHVIFVATLGTLCASVGLAQQTENGTGAQLRVLDKITGIVRDLDLLEGQSSTIGQLTVTLGECRYPSGAVATDAYAWLNILYGDPAEPVFTGWMIASAPALNPLDHPRYDVWALRCTTS